MQKRPIFTDTREAAEALVKDRFVNHDGSQTAAGEKSYGVVNYDCNAGDSAPVDVIGTTIVELGGTVSIGMPLKADASGRAINHDGSGSLNARALGAGDSGDRIEVILIP
jgi:hypothetical protein